MQESMLALIDGYGYAGIAFLIWLENVFPPIPSEVVLLFGGFLTTRTSLAPWGVIFFATVGSTLGAAVLYAIGRIIGKQKIKALLAGRTGKILHLSSEDVDKAETWFIKYESKAVFFCRCLLFCNLCGVRLLHLCYELLVLAEIMNPYWSINLHHPNNSSVIKALFAKPRNTVPHSLAHKDNT